MLSFFLAAYGGGRRGFAFIFSPSRSMWVSISSLLLETGISSSNASKKPILRSATRSLVCWSSPYLRPLWTALMTIKTALSLRSGEREQRHTQLKMRARHSCLRERTNRACSSIFDPDSWNVSLSCTLQQACFPITLRSSSTIVGSAYYSRATV